MKNTFFRIRVVIRDKKCYSDPLEMIYLYLNILHGLNYRMVIRKEMAIINIFRDDIQETIRLPIEVLHISKDNLEFDLRPDINTIISEKYANGIIIYFINIDFTRILEKVRDLCDKNKV
ncbi:MAG: hypothetical protein QXW79_00235 [Thermoplasmata archaeon]